MIKVLHIQETLGSGGVERLRLSLSKLLDKQKFELKIVCTNYGGGIKEEIESNGVEVIPIGKFKGVFDIKNHLKIQKIISKFNPDIIHGAVFEGVTMASINGFIKKVPIIIIEETSDPINRSWKANLLMKLFAKLSNCVIGVSPGVMEYLHQTLRISTDKTTLINNGVKIPRIVSEQETLELNARLGILPNDIVIGSVGRMQMDEHKRFSDLINAFSIVSQSNTHTKLLLVGSGIELKNYQLLTQKLGITDKVIFAGYQSDVDLYYKSMHIFSLVSSYEAFGLVLAEAMLHKLPIIATKVGGMKYIVKDNETGFLVKKYDVSAITDKITALCNDSKVRFDFGEKGYERAMNNYTEKMYVQNIVNLYNNLLKNKIN
jgi:glycosyltransferase involved in cell wall biosynthesis